MRACRPTSVRHYFVRSPRGRPRPPAARISFLLPRTRGPRRARLRVGVALRGKARPPHCLLRPALGPATQRGSHATGALYPFACHASPRSRRTRRARQADAGVRRRSASASGLEAAWKPFPVSCQIGPRRRLPGEEARRQARCGARRRTAQPESAPSDSSRRLPTV